VPAFASSLNLYTDGILSSVTLKDVFQKFYLWEVSQCSLCMLCKTLNKVFFSFKSCFIVLSQFFLSFLAFSISVSELVYFLKGVQFMLHVFVADCESSRFG